MRWSLWSCFFCVFFLSRVCSSFVFFARVLFFFFACFLRDRCHDNRKKFWITHNNKKKNNMYTVTTSATMTSRARTPTTATTSSSKTTFNSRFQKTKKTSKSCRVSSKSGGFHRQNRNRFGENVHRNNVILGGGHEIAQLADWDEETITTVIAAVLGIGAGLGIPIFFVTQEARDKERIEEIRELNRATLKATGEQMSEEEIKELRPNRYLDRREFKDDD